MSANEEHDIRGIIGAVVAGAGWTVIPTYLAASELANGTLRLLHQPELPPTNTLYLATRSGRDNAATQAVVARLKDQARSW